jgi:hypothetical protein
VMTPLEFYHTQAEKAAAEAANTTLERVKERNLRAAEAWLGMASKLELAAELKTGRSGN